MRTFAACLLILLLVLGAVLALPGGLLAAVGAASPGCAHCQGAGPGLTSGCCCSLPGNSGACGNSAQGASVNCRCAAASPACFPPAVTAAPLYPTFPYVLTMLPISSKLFPPNIFRPPESQPFSV